MSDLATQPLVDATVNAAAAALKNATPDQKKEMIGDAIEVAKLVNKEVPVVSKWLGVNNVVVYAILIAGILGLVAHFVLFEQIAGVVAQVSEIKNLSTQFTEQVKSLTETCNKNATDIHDLRTDIHDLRDDGKTLSLRINNLYKPTQPVAAQVQHP